MRYTYEIKTAAAAQITSSTAERRTQGTTSNCDCSSGIYWMGEQVCVMRHVKHVNSLKNKGVALLQDHDEPILKHLEDIKVKFSDPGQPMVSGNHSWEEVASALGVLFTPLSPPPSPELHIRVPFFSQRLLHKHSADKNLQDEVRAGRVGPLLLRRPRDHQLYGVSPLPKPPSPLAAAWLLTVGVTASSRWSPAAARLTGPKARTSRWKPSRRSRSTRAAAPWGRSPRRSPTTPSSTSSPRLKVARWRTPQYQPADNLALPN